MTLVEILVVVIIIAIIGAAAIPSLKKSNSRSQAPTQAIGAATIWSGIQLYRIEHHGKFPPVALFASKSGADFIGPAKNAYIQRWPSDNNNAPIEVTAISVASSAGVTSYSTQSPNKLVYLVSTNQLYARVIMYSTQGTVLYEQVVS